MGFRQAGHLQTLLASRPDVPTINAILSFVLQPAPILFAAPSPTIVTSRASANAGQRNVNASERRAFILDFDFGQRVGREVECFDKIPVPVAV